MKEFTRKSGPYSGQLIGRNTISSYIRGGKGVVTLLSPSGKYHTYAFNYPSNPSDFPAGSMFVYCKVREGIWRYVGMLTRSGHIRITRMSRYSAASPIFRGASYVTRMMREEFDTPMQLWHEGVCSICGRPLTNPKSIASGIGPKCKQALNNC